MPTYSFTDVLFAMEGPGGSVRMSADDAVADEGITIEMIDDKTSMTTGAGRGAMHNLHASNAGRVRVRLLKTNPWNAVLMGMMNFQSTSSAYTGQNTITLSNPVWGDDHSCRQCAFVKRPDNVNGKDGGMMEWTFNSADVSTQLGIGMIVSGA